MKLAAAFVGAMSLLAGGAGLWLASKTLRFVLGPDYRLFPDVGNGGSGLGIFVPALLLLVVAWYLAKFAQNLWKA